MANSDSFPVGNVPGDRWGFQARLLPYFESKEIYKLCNFSYQALLSWVASLPVTPGQEPGRDDPQHHKCPDDPNSGKDLPNYVHPLGGNYGCRKLFRRDGHSPTANDGILLSRRDTPPSLAQITDGASHTIIMGERGISDDLYGWPYCGCGDPMARAKATTSCSTQSGLSPGTRRQPRLSLLELPSQPGPVPLGRWFRWPDNLRHRFCDVPGHCRRGPAGRWSRCPRFAVESPCRYSSAASNSAT